MIKVCPKCGGTGKIQDDNSLGESMKKKRQKAHLTLKKVAEHMKLSVGYVCDLEHGRRIWRADIEKRYYAAIEQGGKSGHSISVMAQSRTMAPIQANAEKDT